MKRTRSIRRGGDGAQGKSYAQSASPLSAVDLDALERRAWNADGLDYETSIALLQRVREADAALSKADQYRVAYNSAMTRNQQLERVREVAQRLVDGNPPPFALTDNTFQSALFYLRDALAAAREVAS